ncbi:hypothetical protein [Cryptosporangium arvum]|uniref:Uncharacterized protein n=1 Tax=Cryptosporangium arvum DSM 44712 TaxID=927661 RepID=A0A010Z3B6_9ACTN|nr:hypothetical protein [Cryptosporangium arvum]EXG81903.1 hypothetical protein CryarDRAFT_3025 [Cryptosporangium arvum DSM 44712]
MQASRPAIAGTNPIRSVAHAVTEPATIITTIRVSSVGSAPLRIRFGVAAVGGIGRNCASRPLAVPDPSATIADRTSTATSAVLSRAWPEPTVSRPTTPSTIGSRQIRVVSTGTHRICRVTR